MVVRCSLVRKEPPENRKENRPTWLPTTTKSAPTSRNQDRSLEALKFTGAPDARSLVTDADALDEGLTHGGEIISVELIVQVIPQAKDEFTCSS